MTELLALGDRLKAPMVHAHARQGACRVGEPLRRRHDRADRLLVRLLRDARLRCPADARDRLSVSAILPAGTGRPHRAGRHQGRADRAARPGRSRRRRRCQGDARARCCRCSRRNATAAHLDAGDASIIARRARASTSWPSASRAGSRSTRSRSPRRSAIRPQPTRSSPAMSVCRRYGRRAIWR